MKTVLSNRTLWFDGTTEVTADKIPELLLLGVTPNKLSVIEHNADTIMFNNLSDDEQLTVGKTENLQPDYSWVVPERYATLDVGNYVTEILRSRRLLEDAAYKTRLSLELREIKHRKMEPLIRCLIYVVDTLKNQQIFWGVGRGSSCASLVLFLIGLHCIDPVKYQIQLEEFYHD